MANKNTTLRNGAVVPLSTLKIVVARIRVLFEKGGPDAHPEDRLIFYHYCLGHSSAYLMETFGFGIDVISTTIDALVGRALLVGNDNIKTTVARIGMAMLRPSGPSGTRFNLLDPKTGMPLCLHAV